MFASFLFVSSAQAEETQLKPGLWELQNKMTSTNPELKAAAAEMQKQLASMPPAQRKMMEDMMAKQGVKMGSGGPFEMAVNICLTQEMIEKNSVPVQEGNCKTIPQKRTGNVVKMAFSCTNPASSGEGQYTVVSPKAYTMKMTIRSAIEGRTQTMNMDANGKWLAADCGDVKPRPTAR